MLNSPRGLPQGLKGNGVCPFEYSKCYILCRVLKVLIAKLYKFSIGCSNISFICKRDICKCFCGSCLGEQMKGIMKTLEDKLFYMLNMFIKVGFQLQRHF